MKEKTSEQIFEDCYRILPFINKEDCIDGILKLDKLVRQNILSRQIKELKEKSLQQQKEV